MATDPPQSRPCAQIENFLSAGYVPQPKQWEIHTACRLADRIRSASAVHGGRAQAMRALRSWCWTTAGAFLVSRRCICATQGSRRGNSLRICGGRGEPSSAVSAHVEAACAVQAERFAPLGKPHVLVNGDMEPAEVQRFCQVDKEGKSLIRAAVRMSDPSARSYHRVLKLARTIADLAGDESLQTQHLTEALPYWPQDLV